jgi:hypothetical protein
MCNKRTEMHALYLINPDDNDDDDDILTWEGRM